MTITMSWQAGNGIRALQEHIQRGLLDPVLQRKPTDLKLQGLRWTPRWIPKYLSYSALVVLRLANCMLQDRGLVAVAAAARHLRELLVPLNLITTQGAIEFSEQCTRQLTVLDLTGNPDIGPRG